MRIIVAGFDDATGIQVLNALGGLVTQGGVLEDSSQLEDAIHEGRPDAVALYLGDRPSAALQIATRVRALFPHTRVVAIADRDEPELVNLVAGAGCADLALLEYGLADIRRAVEILANRDAPNSKDGKVIAVLGAKGGVGTTTVAINLAAEVAGTTSLAVILVDLYTYLGDVAAVLDISPEPTALWYMTRSGPHADWAAGMPKHRGGFRVLGLDGDLTEAQPVTAQQVVYLLDRLREHHDYVFVDCGSNLTEVSLAACSASDQRLLVLTEELPSVLGARRRLQTLKSLDLGAPLAQAVVNRFHPNSKADKAAVEGALGIPMLGALTNAWQEVHSSLEGAKLLREAAPKSRITQDFAALAQTFTGVGAQVQEKKRNFFEALWKG
jgi:pilus assembly protein CpaE